MVSEDLDQEVKDLLKEIEETEDLKRESELTNEVLGKLAGVEEPAYRDGVLKSLSAPVGDLRDKLDEMESSKETGEKSADRIVTSLDDDSLKVLQVFSQDIQLNPVQEVYIQSLDRAFRRWSSSKEKVNAKPLFMVYSFQLGSGSEEPTYKLLTPPHERVRLGDNRLPIKEADLSDGDYREYLRQIYRNSNLDMSFEDWITNLQKGVPEYFEKSDQISKSSKQALRNLSTGQLIDLVKEYLEDGFQKDETLMKVLTPKLVVHDRENVQPQDVMPYSPHSMVFTNTGVGKSFTAEKIGERRDQVSSAGLVGYVDSDGKNPGDLDNMAEHLFADEVNFNDDRKLNDELLSLMETGEVTQSKASKSMKTRFYGSVTYFGNPVESNDTSSIADKFRVLLDSLGENTQAMGSRIGVVVFREDLDAARGEPLDPDRRKKLATVVEWIKSQIAEEYSEIEQELKGWLEEEFPEDYKDKMEEYASEMGETLQEFWLNHLEAYRHTRGQALRMAVFQNLGEVLSRDYDIQELREEADRCFDEVLEINIGSAMQMCSILKASDSLMARNKAVWDSEDEYLRFFIGVLAIKSKNEESRIDEVMPVSKLSSLASDWKEALGIESSRYKNWSRVVEQLSKNQKNLRPKLRKRYGIQLSKQEDVLIVKIADENKFNQYRDVIADMPDTNDTENDSNSQQWG